MATKFVADGSVRSPCPAAISASRRRPAATSATTPASQSRSASAASAPAWAMRADAEVVAHPVEGGGEVGVSDGVADADPGHAVRLGEGPHADDAGVARVDRGDRVGGREVGIGLVETEHGVAGHPRDHLGDALSRVPRAGRVVGVREVEERRARLARGEKQRLGVLGVVAIGDGDELAAEARDVEGEGRIGAGRGDDGRAGGDEQADEEAEQTVDTLADDDVLRADAVVGGERGLQVAHLGVAVHPGLGGGVGHRGDGARRRAEDALVGADAGDEGPARGALLRLGTDEGHGGGQARRGGRGAWSDHGG